MEIDLLYEFASSSLPGRVPWTFGWEASPESQQDASFEQSYVNFVEQTSREVLGEVVGFEADSRKKNDKQPLS